MQQITMSHVACVAIFSLAMASLSPAAAIDTPGNTNNNNNGATVAPPKRVPAAAQFLQVHNDARRAVGVAPLVWNATLELDAKRKAEALGVQCNILSPLKWDSDRFYGGNNFWGSGFVDGAAVAGTWVDERRWYDHRAGAHNDARRAVGVAPLVWNATLELDAKRKAEALGVQCNILSPLKWDSDRFYGGNNFWGSGFVDGAAVAGTWVDERRWYDHRAGACVPGHETCRSYTQVVWNTTTQLGCARRTCRSSGDTVGVCRYFPPGNYAGVPPY